MEEWRHLRGFAAADELASLRDLIGRCRPLFRPTRSTAGLGPNCLRIAGDPVREHLPALVGYGDRVVRPAVEALAGRALQPASDFRRAIRVQMFAGRAHSFRWHFDISPFAALLTIDNPNQSETQIVATRLSGALRLGFYALYWLPSVFSLLPHRAVVAGAGDLLVMRGAELLHRGVARGAGERIIVTFTYDEIGAQPNRVRARVARFLNDGY